MGDNGGRSQGSDPEESQHQRLQRNWAELLQELRVTQTGIQLLAGFLLTLPFASRFTTLDSTQETVYLAIVIDAFAATGLLVAPVALHRGVFRLQHKEWLVVVAHQLARAGLVLMSLAFAGAVWLVYDFVVGGPASWVASAGLFVFLVLLWFVLPMWARVTDGD
jgi:hypothetical protein